jgi:hypothetical protein
MINLIIGGIAGGLVVGGFIVGFTLLIEKSGKK